MVLISYRRTARDQLSENKREHLNWLLEGSGRAQDIVDEARGYVGKGPLNSKPRNWCRVQAAGAFHKGSSGVTSSWVGYWPWLCTNLFGCGLKVFFEPNLYMVLGGQETRNTPGIGSIVICRPGIS